MTEYFQPIPGVTQVYLEEKYVFIREKICAVGPLKGGMTHRHFHYDVYTIGGPVLVSFSVPETFETTGEEMHKAIALQEWADQHWSESVFKLLG